MSTEPRGRPRADAPRTLAEDLRGQPDEALAALFRTRPDLLSPVIPNDLTQLATRAGSRASVLRALERLDRFALQTAEALAVAPDPCPYERLTTLLPGEAAAAALPGALARLRRRALVWGEDDRPHLVRTARELLAPTRDRGGGATGLGPTLAEATSGMSPARLQRVLSTLGLPTTPDPVSAVAALTALFTDRARMAALLATAPPEAHQVLAKLQWGPPYGAVAATGDERRHDGTGGRRGDARDEGGDVPEATDGPVRWLLARGLLLPAGPRTVVLPREVALHLRDGRAHRALEPEPPEVTPARPAGGTPAWGGADDAAAGRALEAVATVEELLKLWETAGPTVLRSGGLGVRELKRTAVALDMAEPDAVFWIELAYAAGLVAADGEEEERYAPTPAYDRWRDLPPQERWAELVTAWLPATRVPGLVGTRDSRGRALSALGPGLDRAVAPEVRHRVLELLAELPAGQAADASSLVARLAWERPLRLPTEQRDQLTTWTLREAESLGVTGRGALCSAARALLAAAGPAPTAAAYTAARATAAERLAPLLPEPLDHVLLQADLTAVAPGPLERELAETLHLAAEVESKGGATVYRFTPGSVRRALDAGRTAAELKGFLAEHSRTPLPQPLAYLVDDVARRHGRLRVGAASAYLRCEDDATLAEVLADRRASGLGLRRLAPGVVVAQSPPDTVLARLREMGYAPAAESTFGDVLITRPEPRRTPPRAAPEPVPEGPAVPDEALLSGAVRALRAGDRAARGASPAAGDTGNGAAQDAGSAAVAGDGDDGAAVSGPPRGSAADTLATLQSATLAGDLVCIGLVDADGRAGRRVVAPVRVADGRLTAYDHTVDEVGVFPLHRITGAEVVADDPAAEASAPQDRPPDSED